MLVIVEFNYRLFRFREEDENRILIYNLRKGSIYFLTGEMKELICKFKNNKRVLVNQEDKRMDYLLKQKIILAGENVG